MSSSAPEPRASTRTVIFTALAAFLLRAPFAAAPGFGLDADAWLIAASAEGLAHGAGWTPSRPPGYPLSELFYALFIRGGPLLCNMASAATVALAAALGTAWLLRRGVRAPWALPLAAVGVPAIAGPAASALDHGPALALLAGAWLALDRVRPGAHRAALLCGTLFGLACAARPPFGVMVLPLLYVAVRRGGLRSAVALSAGASPWIAAVLVPFALRGLWPDAPTVLSARVELNHAVAILTYAPLGAAGVAALVLVGLGLLRNGARARGMGLGWATIATFGLAAVFPLEANYLAPTVFTGALWLALRVRPAAAIAACALIQIGGFVSVTEDGIGAGPWRREVWARSALVARSAALHGRIQELPASAVAVVGGDFAAVRYLLRGEGPTVVATLDEAARAAYAAQGRPIFELTPREP